MAICEIKRERGRGGVVEREGVWWRERGGEWWRESGEWLRERGSGGERERKREREIEREREREQRVSMRVYLYVTVRDSRNMRIEHGCYVVGGTRATHTYIHSE